GSEFLEGYSINCDQNPIRSTSAASPNDSLRPITERTSPASDLSELPVLPEPGHTNIIEGAARTSRSSGD
ncbi:GH13966, partial [Drosophila grimshawi]